MATACFAFVAAGQEPPAAKAASPPPPCKDLYHTVRRETFAKAVADLQARVPTLQRNEIIAGMIRIAAFDFVFPFETSRKPFFELLGTPAQDKRHVVLSGGHLPPQYSEIVKEILAWTDMRLGPVRR